MGDKLVWHINPICCYEMRHCSGRERLRALGIAAPLASGSNAPQMQQPASPAELEMEKAFLKEALLQKNAKKFSSYKVD